MASTGTAKKSFLQLDEEGKKLNQSIKWPPKTTPKDNLFGFLTILLLFISSGLASPVYLIYPLVVLLPLVGRPGWRNWNGYWASTWYGIYNFCDIIFRGISVDKFIEETLLENR
jgi:hypothetical protein